MPPRDKRRRGQYPQIKHPKSVSDEVAWRSAHFFIGHVALLEADAFAQEVYEQAKKATRFPGKVLVFVHGYANTHDDALVAAAQMKRDLYFDGPVVVFSWPASGDVAGYVHDKTAAANSTGDFSRFLVETASYGPELGLSIILHSMGSRVVLPSLAQLNRESGAGHVLARVGRIGMMAPAIEWDGFDIALDQIGRYKIGITVYCSRKDLALWAADSVAAERVPMVGACPEQAQALGAAPSLQLEFMDITRSPACHRSSDPTCDHAIAFRDDRVLGDIHEFLREGKPGRERSARWTELQVQGMRRPWSYYRYDP